MTLPVHPSSSERQIPAVCRMLRTKTAFGIFEGDDHDPWEFGESTTAVYWCLCTMQNAGPDDLLAHPDCCRDDRPCYQPRD